MKFSKKYTFWVIILLFSILLFRIFEEGDRGYKKISYPEFYRAVKNKQIESVTLQGQNQIMGKFQSTYDGGSLFKLIGVRDKAYDLLEQHEIIPEFIEEEKPNFIQSLFLSWGPILLLIAIFYFFLKQIQAGGGKAMSFGKSKAKLHNENDKKVTFKDVSGVQEAKDELIEIIDFLKDPKKYTKLGGKIPKGVILVGPPGTGKTLLARSVAGEAMVPFFAISGSDFVEMFVGVGASRVRDLFEQGKKHAPCIIFIDEIDAVGRHRGSGLGGGHDEREQTLNQLLVEMDGFETNEGVILIAATNRIDVLDSALLRPGRFDRRVSVGVPDVKGRLGILKVHTRKTPLKEALNLEAIAKGTPGFTGADLANLVNEAALNAARLNKKHLEDSDFEMAKDKVLMGPERRSMVISEREKKITAYHEAGHALVGLNLPYSDPIHKISIMPRGSVLGVTQTLPNEDMLNLTKEKGENFLAFLMGGRCAEELIFNEISSGASNDIERITSLAHNMVCTWGMSENLGLRYYKRPGMFLSNSNNSGDDHHSFSETMANKIDLEIDELIEKNYNLATEILEKHKDVLHRLAKGLILWETLDMPQVQKLIDGEDIGIPIVETEKMEHSPESIVNKSKDLKDTKILKPNLNPV